MKRLIILLWIAIIVGLSGCDKFSSGNTVVVLPDDTSIRHVYYNAIVTNTKDGIVVVNVTSALSIYNDQELQVTNPLMKFNEAEVYNPEDGLTVLDARKKLFSIGSEIHNIANNTGETLAILHYRPDYLKSLMDLSKKANTPDWTVGLETLEKYMAFRNSLASDIRGESISLDEAKAYIRKIEAYVNDLKGLTAKYVDEVFKTSYLKNASDPLGKLYAERGFTAIFAPLTFLTNIAKNKMFDDNNPEVFEYFKKGILNNIYSAQKNIFYEISTHAKNDQKIEEAIKRIEDKINNLDSNIKQEYIEHVTFMAKTSFTSQLEKNDGKSEEEMIQAALNSLDMYKYGKDESLVAIKALITDNKKKAEDAKIFMQVAKKLTRRLANSTWAVLKPKNLSGSSYINTYLKFYKDVGEGNIFTLDSQYNTRIGEARIDNYTLEGGFKGVVHMQGQRGNMPLEVSLSTMADLAKFDTLTGFIGTAHVPFTAMVVKREKPIIEPKPTKTTEETTKPENTPVKVPVTTEEAS